MRNFRWTCGFMSLGWLAIAITLALAPPALAQEDDDGDLLGIDEIVVTAERRSQSLQDVAATINAFSLDDLTKQNIQDIYDLQNEVPSLVATGGLPAITLRGIGQDTEVLGPGIDPGFQLHINDIYVSQIAVALLDFHDLERVEVLPGPQGTSSGRNSTGGSINFHHARPDLENHIVKGEFELGSYDKVRAGGVVNVPLIKDELGLRVAWLQEWPAKPYDVRGQNGHTQKLRASSIGAGTSIRTILRWQPTEDLTTDFILSWSRDTNPGSIGRFQNGNPSFGAGANPALSPRANYTAATPQPSNDLSFRQDLQNKQRYEVLWGQWITTYEMPNDLTLKLNANYQYFDFELMADNDSSDLPIGFGTLEATSSTWSGEVTIASGWDGPFNFVFGANYQTVADKTRTTAPDFQAQQAYAGFQIADSFALVAGANPITSARVTDICGGPCIFQPARAGYVGNFDIRGETDTEALGIFLDGTYEITDQWSVTAGVRYSYTSRDFNDYGTQANLILEPFDAITDNAACLAAGIPAFLAPTKEACFGIISGLLLTPGFVGAGGAPATTANTLFLAPVAGGFDPTSPSFGTQAFTREDSWNSLTGRLRLEWRPIEDQLFYLSVSTGERHGGFQFVGAPFDSEEIIAYEFGAKNSFLDGRMFLNTSFFYYDFENRFLQQTENNIPSILNAPSSEVMGIEVQWLFVVTEALRLNVNAGWLKAEFNERFVTQDNTPTPGNPDGYCPFKQVGDQYGWGPTCDGGTPQDINGNSLPRSPEFTVSVGIEYVMEFSQGNLTTRLDFSWRDDFDFRWFENEFDKSDDFTRTDIRARWDPHSGWWWAEVYVQNLEDDRDIRNQVSNTTTVRRNNHNPPIAFGLRVGYEFQNSALPWVD